MATCTVCPFCTGASIADALEVARVPCNVRRLRDHRFTVWRCSGCNSLHSVEDADLPYYYKHYPFQKHSLDFHARVGYGNRLRLLERRGLTRDARVLDYGCGTGLFIEFLRGKGYAHAFGYDAFVSEWSDPAVLRHPYDAVVSYDVIEHVDDPASFVRELGALAIPNGLLVIGTPNADHVPMDPDNLLTPELSQPYHRHILSEAALAGLLAQEGFTAEHIHRRFYFDSLYPSVNTRFIWNYIAKTGGMIDAAVEPPQTGMLLRSPAMWFYALFGYFLPVRSNILVSARKKAVATRERRESERELAAHGD